MSDWHPQEYFHQNKPKNNASKTNSSSNQERTVDITDKLNTVMAVNTEELSQVNESFGCWAATMYFEEMVRPGGEWDFKSQASWDLDPSTTYIYEGVSLRYDDIGNIHYGYVGRVLFNEQILLQMGGAVQIVTRTSKLSYYKTWFDDPHDSKMISYGYHLWDVN